MGKVPTFESADGKTLFESGAIAYYIAAAKPESKLLGTDLYENAQVQQWLAFADNEVYAVYAAWLYPILGYADYNAGALDKAKVNAKRFMGALNEHLLRKTFLVGESITLADITLVCHLLNLYTMVFDASFRGEFVNVNRWFVTCVNQPNFKSVLGEVRLCEKAQVYKKPEVKKEAPKPAAAPAESPAAEEKPKAKNPLDLLPPSSLVLDEWKRFYSNNDTRPTACDWFWKNFDAEGYSLWKVDYKYNNELTMTFMSSNLVGGFFQRLERARKYAFGSMVVLGTDNKNEITGFFIIRGQEIPPEVYEAADYESYDFTKMDSTDKKIQEDFNSIIAWDETIYGKKFADGKVFK